MCFWHCWFVGAVVMAVGDVALDSGFSAPAKGEFFTFFVADITKKGRQEQDIEEEEGQPPGVAGDFDHGAAGQQQGQVAAQNQPALPGDGQAPAYAVAFGGKPGRLRRLCLLVGCRGLGVTCRRGFGLWLVHDCGLKRSARAAKGEWFRVGLLMAVGPLASRCCSMARTCSCS